MRRIILLITIIVISALSSKSQNINLGNFEDQNIGNWSGWNCTPAVVANPSKIGNTSNYVGLFDGTGGAWEGFANWVGSSFFSADYVKISVDAYIENTDGVLQLYLGNAANSGAPTITTQLPLAANTWTTLEFDISTLTAFDYQQIAFQNAAPVKIYLDNITVIEGTVTDKELSNFENQLIDPWDTWATPKPTVVANPSKIVNISNYCAKIEQTTAWSNNIKRWDNTPIVANKYDRLSVDVYLADSSGTFKLYLDNSISGAPNIEKYLDVEANTWTTLEFDLTDLTAYDYKQIAFLSGRARNFYVDNIKFLVPEVPVADFTVITRETFGTKAWDTDGPARTSGFATHWKSTDVNTFTSTNGTINGGSDLSVRINQYPEVADANHPWDDASKTMSLLMAVPAAYSGSWDTVYFKDINISGFDNLKVNFGRVKRNHNTPKAENIRGLNVEARIDGGAWIQLDTSLMTNPLAYVVWEWISLPIEGKTGKKLNVRFSNYYNQNFLDDITITGKELEIIEPVVNFTAATISSSRIGLSWTKNADNDDVIIASNKGSEVAGAPVDGTEYEAGNALPGGGTIIYNGPLSTFTNTGLSINSEYFYKIWSVSDDIRYSESSSSNTTTFKPEPTNHVQSFIASSVTSNSITLGWNEIAGGNLADGYLIYANLQKTNIPIPPDGVAINEDTDLSDGNGSIEVAPGNETYTWNNLQSDTTYYFAIYPFSKSGDHYDYKTLAAPSATGITDKENTSVATPEILPDAGNYSDPINVSITCATDGASIYYTTNGDQPSNASTLYNGVFQVTTSSVVKALAILDGNSSNVATAQYTIGTPVVVSAPVVTPDGGDYVDQVSVSITCDTEGSGITYKINSDGQEVPYTGEFIIAESCSIYATSHVGDISSNVTFVTYNITLSPISTPVITPAAGEYSDPLMVDITCSTAGVSIYYTINGSNPTRGSIPFTGKFEVSQDATVKAIAVKGDRASEIAQAVFTINAKPVIVNSIKALRNGKTDGTIYQLSSNAVVTFEMDYRNQKYVQDATAAILIDDNSGLITTQFIIGDGIINLTGTLYDYSGLLEFVPTENANKVIATAIIPQEIGINEFKNNFEEYESELIKLKHLKFETPGTFENGKNYVIGENGVNTVLRTHFYDMDYIGTEMAKGSIDLSGIALWHYSEAKIVPRSKSDITVLTSITDLGNEVRIYGIQDRIIVDATLIPNSDVTIYSIDGKKITSQRITESHSVIKIGSKGIYLVHYKADNSTLKVEKVALY